MARFCEGCGFQVGDAAKFCKQCGRGLPPRSNAVSAVPGSPAAVAEAPVRTADSPRASSDVAHLALPPRDLRSGSAQRRTSLAFSNLGQSARLTVIGSAIAFVGCFLPLLSGMGENTAIIPTVVNEVPHALLVPLSAAALAAMAWGASSGNMERRALLGGGVIAIASPWTALWTLSLFAAQRAMAAFGGYWFGEAIGPGVVVLALGFGCSLAGGFIIVRESARARFSDQQRSHQGGVGR